MKNQKTDKLSKIRRGAIERIAKTEQLQIRLDPELWDVLYTLAGQRRVHISTMVRDWIKDRVMLETPNESAELSLSKTVQKLDLLLSNISKLFQTSGKVPNGRTGKMGYRLKK